MRDPGEDCDPEAAVSGCPSNLVCGAAGTENACRCVPPSGELVEICGNCIDDDGNGLTDFEDPACCPDGASAMDIRRLRIRPKGLASKLRIRSTLAKSGLVGVDPLSQDVFLQMRPPQGLDVLCAKVPAMKFMRMHGPFKFWDHAHATTSAKGIDDMTITVRGNGQVRFRTWGRRVQMSTPPRGRLQVTVGFRNPLVGDGANRCSTGSAPPTR